MGILTPLYEKTNHVLERQRYYQNSHNLVHLRGPRQRLYVGAFSVMFAFGMCSTVYAINSLVTGKKAES